ncbi:hypothetical protein BDV59DRAFT_207047 [Aspergillus ambiguus]|uniref:transcription factor domain-containing protein n=1 Tax=Aspergillus ambiguus TaxID=176160 RepID=UPI003CCE0FA9
MWNSRMRHFRVMPNGAKSCTECRRRKVRCVRIPDDAQECRQCQERGVACLAQIASPRPRQTQRLPSRLRITQLETQVSDLTKALNRIESKLQKHRFSWGEQTVNHNLEAEDSERASSVSDLIDAEEPSHLRSLFQNHWLSVDTDPHDRQQQERLAKASVHLLEAARPELQKLIPSREEARDITTHAYDWLVLLELTFPQPFAAKSQRDIMDNYEKISQPNVDVIRMTTWLLEVAITALQVSQGPNLPESDRQNCGIVRRKLAFSRSVSETVEAKILAHDRLVGTLEGLGMALHFVRLQIGHGNFQKAWIRLRHIIAIAELMGLPKTVQLFRLKRPSTSGDEKTLAGKAQLWESICSIDRLLGIMINLPPDTGRYHHTSSSDLVVNGVVQPRTYLCQLTEIATRVHDLEYMNATHEPRIKLYTLALEIAQEVGELASRTPASWWVYDAMDGLKADHIIQFIHYCVVMRVHLPLALRQDRGEDYLYSRLACMDACTSIVQRYQFVRRTLNSGMFMSRVLDLQAFTATVVLLLTSHGSPSMDQYSIRIDKDQLETQVFRVIELMQEKSKDKAGADFAELGMRALCALNGLLKQGDNVAGVQGLTLNVPLLGKIHIRRNTGLASARPEMQSSGAMAVGPLSSELLGRTLLSGHDPISVNAESYISDNLPAWQWNGLSWDIEEGAATDLLGDTLPLVHSDQPILWQNSV